LPDVLKLVGANVKYEYLYTPKYTMHQNVGKSPLKRIKNAMKKYGAVLELWRRVWGVGIELYRAVKYGHCESEVVITPEC
jgi:hypothetical protein